MTLNTSQQNICDNLRKFITDANSSRFYILGKPGTGKTFLVSNFLLSINKDYNIYICTPTHTAIYNIKSYIERMIIENDVKNVENLNFDTIHTFLELKPKIITKTGELYFSNNNKVKKKKKKSIIVIDECSMIDDNVYSEINKFIAKNTRVKFIFVGDQQQLPPVNTDNSKIFNKINNCEYYFELDEIMRTKSKNIIGVMDYVRDWDINVCLKLANFLPFISNDFEMHVNSKNLFRKRWFKKLYKDTSNIPLILTWRNSTCNYYNNLIKGYYSGKENLNNYDIGDYIMFNHHHSCNTIKDEIAGENSFCTGERAKIINVIVSKKNIANWNIKSDNNKHFNNILRRLTKIKCNMTINTMIIEKSTGSIHNINIDINKNIGIKTINNICIDEYKNYIERIKNLILGYYNKYDDQLGTDLLWEKYYDIVNKYADIIFGYSITVHKSQGGTFDIVIIDVNDINLNKNISEMKKCLYTAIGRARSKLIFIV